MLDALEFHDLLIARYRCSPEFYFFDMLEAMLLITVNT